jgi:hypothetical protein
MECGICLSTLAPSDPDGNKTSHNEPLYMHVKHDKNESSLLNYTVVKQNKRFKSEVSYKHQATGGAKSIIGSGNYKTQMLTS